MQTLKRSASIIDEEVINEILNNDWNKKSKMTDLICSMINYFSLVPTLFYNAVWFFYFKSALEAIGEDSLLSTLEKEIPGCSELFHWTNYSFTWVIISFSKGLFFLTCVRICCGAENDCNMFCLLVKSVTSLIPAIFFVLKIPDHVNSYKALNLNIINGNKETELIRGMCDHMADKLLLYYKWESAYLICMVFVFCVLPVGALLMCLKEYLKSRGKQE